MIIAVFLLTMTISLVSCSNNDDASPVIPPVQSLTPSEIISSVTWITTTVKTQDGTDVTASRQGFVGYSNFRSDGTFQIREMDNVTERSSGTWALTPDGLKRILVFSPTDARIVDILKLNENIFTYRINAGGTILDVEHIPVVN